MPPPKKAWESEEERQEQQRALGRAHQVASPTEGSGSAEALPAAVLQSGPVAAAHHRHHHQQQQQCDGAAASFSSCVLSGVCGRCVTRKLVTFWKPPRETLSAPTGLHGWWRGRGRQ
jgi:hypothetical protein